MFQLNAIFAIAARDFTKLLRDRIRVVFSFVFPVIFLGIFGGSLQANLGNIIGYNFLTFTFIGVFGQVLFQSTASGIISLISDRENDFSQEIFVSPISRYSIIAGKILGESLVAYVQAIGLLIFAFIIRVPLELSQLLLIIPLGFVACLLGGAFGVLVLANLSDQRSANQIFPFVIFPQFFLAGVFNPIKELSLNNSPVLFVLSRITPLTYVVDFLRGIYYWGTPQYNMIVLYPPWVDLAVIALMFVVMLFIGTFIFVKNERNR
jgi:ABC-2 type transport system permease protein